MTNAPIYFLRHGETDWNRQSRIQGRTDIPLNAAGHRQSATVAGMLAPHRVERLITSPLTRAKETMAHVCRALGRSSSVVEIAPEVVELGFGVWEGRYFHELAADPVFPKDLESHFHWRPDGGESHGDGVARVRDWVLSIREPTIIVAHGAIGRCLIGLLTGLASEALMRVPAPQGAFCKIVNGTAEWFDQAAKSSEKTLDAGSGLTYLTANCWHSCKASANRGWDGSVLRASGPNLQQSSERQRREK